MIVVSTELLSALYIEGGLTDIADAVMARDPDWATPLIWRSLLPQHLSDAVSCGQLNFVDARRVADAAAALFRDREFAAPVKCNLECVLAGCPPAMAPFVSVAKGIGIKLVTTCHDVMQAFPDCAVSATRFAAGD